LPLEVLLNIYFYVLAQPFSQLSLSHLFQYHFNEGVKGRVLASVRWLMVCPPNGYRLFGFGSCYEMMYKEITRSFRI
jgi:hypothetical protein